jgi:TolB-like protein/DNA-binding winged helix-turn-helix (wHTH) protein
MRPGKFAPAALSRILSSGSGVDSWAIKLVKSMSGNGSNPSQLRFGVFELDLEAKELRKAGIKIHLQPQPFQVLAVLASRSGELVSREELQQKLWADNTFVDFDRSLTAAVKRLRIALNDDADTPRYIETIPRRGYRMIFPVAQIQSAAQVEFQHATGLRPRYVGPGRLAFAILLLGIAGYYFGFLRIGAIPSRRTMLVILPFESLDPKVETYFSDSLTEELIAQLGELNPSALGVIARTSAMHYKGTHQTVSSIGRDLGVDYVLEGSVRRQDDKVRITVQLIRVSDQTHLWAHSYDRNFENALTLEGELAHAIGREVSINVPDAASFRFKNEKRRSASAEAQQLYLQGLFYWNKRYGESLKMAQSCFMRAISYDPNYALAYSGLADADFVLAMSGTESLRTVMPPAKDAALKAVQLEPDLAEGHISLAQILSNYDWNWTAAEREYRRGIELNANYATGHLWYATFLMNMGRSDEAISELRQAQELDPLSSTASTFLGKAYYYNREYDKAINQYKAVLENDPGFPIASSFLVQAYEQAGKLEDAIAEYHRAIPLAGEDVKGATQFSDSLMLAFKAEGPGGYWKKRFQLGTRTSPLEKAALYIRLGQRKEAFEELNEAFSEHDMWLTALKVDPRWDVLRSDSSFEQLLKRVGLK